MWVGSCWRGFFDKLVDVLTLHVEKGTIVLAFKVMLLFSAPVLLFAAGTPSSVSLSSSPHPSVFGSPVALTAVVAPPTAIGSLTFYDRTTFPGGSTITSRSRAGAITSTSKARRTWSGATDAKSCLLADACRLGLRAVKVWCRDQSSGEPESKGDHAQNIRLN
jgi:hypothetical protein